MLKAQASNSRDCIKSKDHLLKKNALLAVSHSQYGNQFDGNGRDYDQGYQHDDQYDDQNMAADPHNS